MSMARAIACCSVRSPCSWRIKVKLMPASEQWSVKPPSSFCFVAPYEQCLIAIDDVEQQGFIGFRQLPECLGIPKAKALGLHIDFILWRLNFKIQIKSF